MNFIKKFMAHARGRARRLYAKVAARRRVPPRSNYVLLIDINLANDGRKARRPAESARAGEEEREARETTKDANPLRCCHYVNFVANARNRRCETNRYDWRGWGKRGESG